MRALRRFQGVVIMYRLMAMGRPGWRTTWRPRCCTGDDVGVNQPSRPLRPRPQFDGLNSLTSLTSERSAEEIAPKDASDEAEAIPY